MNDVPFQTDWKVYQRINDDLYVMFKQNNDNFIYAPVFISNFHLHQPRSMTDKEKFNIRYHTPKMIDKISDKLKYYRHLNSLHQSQVADYVGIDRVTYVRYETSSESYSLDILSKIAELFKIDLIDLLDDYHHFLFFGQGNQVLTFRKSKKLTQLQLGDVLGVHRKTIKRYEKEAHYMSRDVWERFLDLKKICDLNFSQRKNITN